MTNPVSVDVVVATNRNTPYLTEGLLSVVAQTYPHWTLTVVDDGAPDPQAIDDAVHGVVPQATVIHRHLPGPAAGRNRGVRLGSGQLLSFLDDDDVWHPDRLKLSVEAFLRDPDAVGVYSAGWYMDAEGRRFGEWDAPAASSDELLSGVIPIPRIVTLLVPRTRFDAIGGFDESFELAEDDDLILRLLVVGEMSRVDVELVGYRRHANNITNASSMTRHTASDRVILKQIRAARASGDRRIEGLLRSNRAHFMARTAGTATSEILGMLRRGQLRGAWEELAWLARRSPGRAALMLLRLPVVAVGKLLRRVGRQRSAQPGPARGA